MTDYDRLQAEYEAQEYEILNQQMLAEVEGRTYVGPVEVHTVEQYQGF